MSLQMLNLLGGARAEGSTSGSAPVVDKAPDRGFAQLVEQLAVEEAAKEGQAAEAAASNARSSGNMESALLGSMNECEAGDAEVLVESGEEVIVKTEEEIPVLQQESINLLLAAFVCPDQTIRQSMNLGAEFAGSADGGEAGNISENISGDISVEIPADALAGQPGETGTGPTVSQVLEVRMPELTISQGAAGVPERPAIPTPPVGEETQEVRNSEFPLLFRSDRPNLADRPSEEMNPQAMELEGQTPGLAQGGLSPTGTASQSPLADWAAQAMEAAGDAEVGELGQALSQDISQVLPEELAEGAAGKLSDALSDALRSGGSLKSPSSDGLAQRGAEVAPPAPGAESGEDPGHENAENGGTGADERERLASLAARWPEGPREQATYRQTAESVLGGGHTTIQSSAPAGAPVANPLPAGANALPHAVERLQELVANFDRHLAVLTASKDSSITVDLNPPNLGRLTVNCREEGGNLYLEVLADNRFARSFVSSHEVNIRDVVQAGGFKLAQFDVRADGDGSDRRRFEWEEAKERAALRSGRRAVPAISAPAATGAAGVWNGSRTEGLWLVA